MSELPKVKVGRKIYYVDKRLQELRNVQNPHDRIPLETPDPDELQLKDECNAEWVKAWKVRVL